MTTHLASTKDALRQANSSCESLEQKLEETERENRELRTVNLRHQMTIDLKLKIISDLQDRLEGLERELGDIKTEKPKDVPDGASKHSTTSNTTSSSSGRSVYHKDLTGLNQDELLKEHYEIVEDLSIKLQNINYQKNRTQQLLDDLKTENARLGELLDKTELENIDLRSRVSSLEDRLLNNSSSEPATPSLPPQSPPKHFLTKYSAEESPSFSRVTTLQSELLDDYQAMKEKYYSLLSTCRCGSSRYKTGEGGGDGEGENCDDSISDSSVSKIGGDAKGMDPSLKELFQEVYATLKATTVVADRLIERRKLIQS